MASSSKRANRSSATMNSGCEISCWSLGLFLPDTPKVNALIFDGSRRSKRAMSCSMCRAVPIEKLDNRGKMVRSALRADCMVSVEVFLRDSCFLCPPRFEEYSSSSSVSESSSSSSDESLSSSLDESSALVESSESVPLLRSRPPRLKGFEVAGDWRSSVVPSPLWGKRSSRCRQLLLMLSFSRLGKTVSRGRNWKMVSLSRKVTILTYSRGSRFLEIAVGRRAKLEFATLC